MTNNSQHQYKEHLVKIFGQTNNFESFKQIINDELGNKFGSVIWANVQLDIPDSATTSEQIGIIENEFIAEYIDKNFFSHDIVLQHIKHSNKPISRCDVQKFIESSHIQTKDMRLYKNIITMNAKYGYNNSFAIPVTSTIDGTRSALSILSKSKENSPDNFKRICHGKLLELTAFALAITEAGQRFHKKVFYSSINKFKNLKNSRPIEILSIISKEDASLAECAMRLNIKESTARNHLKAFRDKIGVRHNEAAIAWLKQNRIID